MATKHKHRLTKKQKKQIILEIIILALATVGAFTILIAVGKGVVQVISAKHVKKVVQEQPELDVELLSINNYSRPGQALDEVNGIVIHYTANPGSTAIQNRNYFEGLKTSHETMASSHFIIGLDGEIVQCIPTSEVSYASNDRNNDTISIECCHPDETGQFNQATYDSLVELTAYLIGKFDLSTEDVIRHYDVTGKLCPLYYVDNEDAWQQFLADVDSYIDEYGVAQKD
jgi:N-acetylmuramoyl-L-alanine amidase CwlA